MQDFCNAATHNHATVFSPIYYFYVTTCLGDLLFFHEREYADRGTLGNPPTGYRQYEAK